jgi:hypothetical protein
MVTRASTVQSASESEAGTSPPLSNKFLGKTIPQTGKVRPQFLLCGASQFENYPVPSCSAKQCVTQTQTQLLRTGAGMIIRPWAPTLTG